MSEGLGDVGASLSKKIGPFPGYIYVAAIAGVAWALWFRNKNRSTGDSVPVESYPSGGVVDDGTIRDTGVSAPVASGGGNAVLGTVAIQDNVTWIAKGAEYLAGFSYDNAFAVNALTKYTQGLELSLAEKALVNQVISRYGVPPEGVPVSPNLPMSSPTVTAPTPAPAAPATPQTPSTSVEYVTVAKYTSQNPPWNSTLSGIAKRYGTSVSALMKLNPSIRNANVIIPGQRVRVK